MSNLLTLKIAPRGSIVVRDGRPFEPTPGARAATLPWPLPGTVAGMARTLIGNTMGFDWQGDGPERARRIVFHGPLLLAQWPASDWAVYLPAPRDALVPRDTKKVHPLRPMDDLAVGAGCDLPHEALRPLCIPMNEKADNSAAYWPLAAVIDWLSRKDTDAIPLPECCLGEMPRDTRTHVAMDREKQAALEGALFTTEGLAFHDIPNGADPARAMLCRVEAPAGWTAKDTLTSLGGERRLVHIESADDGLWPAAPDRAGGLGKALAGAKRLRLYLATP
ncbi:MAG: type III-B CRISPR module-associated Cmr3 family protein, partial [Chloroflexota bacterium]